MGFTGFTLVMPFLPLYVRELGVSDVGDIALWTGLSLGVTPAITAVCSPLWGRVADRYGNKLLAQRSLLSFLIVMAAMAYVTQPWHLFALRAIQGFVAGYGVLMLSMAAQSAPRERMAQAIGAVQTAQRIGPAIGPVIGGILAPLFGLRRSFLVSAAVYALAFVILTVLYREQPRRTDHVKGEGGRVMFKNILAFENFLLLMFVIFGLQVVDRSFGPVLPLYLGELGYPSARVPLIAGVLFSVLAVSGALGHQLAATLLQRMTARAVIAAATLTGSAALALFAFAMTLWALVPAMAGIGLALGTALTAAFAAAGAVIPPHVHGASFGFLTSASLTGSAVSPVLSGLVGARSIRVVFVAGAVTLALLAIAVRRVMVERTLQIPSTPSVEES